MTDSFVTQCPHCQTSFRVSHAQLSVARGVVRCGSCLQVFNAAKQLLEQRAGKDALAPVVPAVPQPSVEAPPSLAPPTAEEPPAIVEPTVPAPRAISQKQWSASELDLDSLDLDQELARLEQREIQPTTEFGRPREDSLSARRDSPEPDEAVWPDSLFSEPADERTPEPEAEPEIVDIEPIKPERTEPSLSLEPVDLDDEPPIPQLRLHDPIDPNARRERLSASDDADDELSSIEPPRKKRERAEPGVRAEVLQDLTDDPLQLDWQKRRSPWGRRFLWLLLILLAAAGLAGQYVAYHFDELARQDQYRPWFQQLCPQIGCTVPSKVDIAKIKSSNLVVRSHPEFSGALVVDAIIYNRAPFSQPFPLLELRFADLNGHLIASRRFKPGEYLNGDLEGMAEMPPQTPIHIALDILDPGPKAVNYSLSFHSPE
ncbi:DUF3426 domain-containing protein [Pseudomonas botevensis]|uniref:DUF3426 domain-containing protein n=1 Tax=Pseudomonas botevensis TaxID=2842352 RepID=UPI001C3E4660|nr:DUF3426 domain-containing protein [Pseudomonas botevensis]MBV4477983.1 zinc-ribbon domain-containing protein [Pseudomonas botevensis]